MTQREPLRIAVLGAGYMGQNHVKILSSLPEVNLVAVCDLDKQKTKKLAKQYKIKEYSSYPTLLKKERLDAVSICLPTTLHYKAAIKCVSSKAAIFLEKPICATALQAKKLNILVRENNIPLMVGQIERFNPVVNEIKRRISSGELGNVIKIHAQRFSPMALVGQEVSVIVDLATHDIDVMNYLLDDYPVRIFAQTESKFHEKEDMVSAILRFRKGTIGVVEASWMHPTKTRNLTVVGENGVYQANYLTQELFFYRQNRQLLNNNIDPFYMASKVDVVKIAFQSKEPLFLELDAFVYAVRNKLKMPISAQDGLLALEIAEKIVESGTINKVVYMRGRQVE